MRVLLFKGIQLPEAIFCANDEMAFGTIRALTEAGLKVPEDVCVIGFDDILLSSYYNPPLTTIHSPVIELGNQCSAELLRLMGLAETGRGTVTRLSPSMVIRDTCKVRF
jgi:LacI family purine nucleotide synthesis repressor